MIFRGCWKEDFGDPKTRVCLARSFQAAFFSSTHHDSGFWWCFGKKDLWVQNVTFILDSSGNAKFPSPSVVSTVGNPGK